MPLNWDLNVKSQEELVQRSRDVYKETDEKLDQALGALEEWIKKSPHLQQIRQDRQFLLFFLRGCGHSVEKTKKGLDFYFSVKSSLPAWFSGWDPTQASIQNVLKAGVFLPLAGYDKHGRWVYLVRFGAIQPNSMKVDDLYKVALMLLDRALEDNSQAAVQGIVVIYDIGGVTTSHTLMMTPAIMKKHVVVFQDAYPMDNMALIEMSSMHYINMPKIVQSLFNMFLSQTKEMFKKMNHVHPIGKNQGLVEDLGAEVLPVEYGGTGGSLAEITEFWLTEAVKQKDWFARAEKYKSEEEKRPGGKKTHSDLFGIEGSFRKLDID